MSNILLTASSPRPWPSQSRRPPPPPPLPPMSNILETGLDFTPSPSSSPSSITTSTPRLSPPLSASSPHRPPRNPSPPPLVLVSTSPTFSPACPPWSPIPLGSLFYHFVHGENGFSEGGIPLPNVTSKVLVVQAMTIDIAYLHGSMAVVVSTPPTALIRPVAICSDAYPADADFAAVRAFPNSALLRRILDRRLVLPRQGLQDAPRLGLRPRLHHRRRQLHLLLEPQR